MQKRSPAAVLLLSLITFGIYALVWQVKTKNELNRLGAHIPTAWLLIVPLANLYWIWKYSEGVEQVTGGKISAVLTLILLLLLSVVGLAILQSQYNSLNLDAASPVQGDAGMAPQPQASQPVPISVSPSVVSPTAAVPPTPTPPPVSTPVFPTPPTPPPAVDGPAGAVQPPVAPAPSPPTLPPSPIQ